MNVTDTSENQGEKPTTNYKSDDSNYGGKNDYNYGGKDDYNYGDKDDYNYGDKDDYNYGDKYDDKSSDVYHTSEDKKSRFGCTDYSEED